MESTHRNHPYHMNDRADAYEREELTYDPIRRRRPGISWLCGRAVTHAEASRLLSSLPQDIPLRFTRLDEFFTNLCTRDDHESKMIQKEVSNALHTVQAPWCSTCKAWYVKRSFPPATYVDPLQLFHPLVVEKFQQAYGSPNNLSALFSMVMDEDVEEDQHSVKMVNRLFNAVARTLGIWKQRWAGRQASIAEGLTYLNFQCALVSTIQRVVHDHVEHCLGRSS
jgi:hypothetical protein